MLITVVDQCLTLAIASANRHVSQRRTRSVARGRWEAPLAAYPRLAEVLQRASTEGLLTRRYH